jgi:hypothetical protein
MGDWPESVKSEIEHSGFFRDWMPASGYAEYRVQIDIDGHTNSWPGLFQKLLTGSPVIKIASLGNYSQWYYDRLVPWSNYVPVAADMLDLVDKVRWLLHNDSEAEVIGQRGAELAHAMTYEAESLLAMKIIDKAMQSSFLDGIVA